ncbi:NAD-dependent protein deacetylase [Luteimonas sp. A478]
MTSRLAAQTEAESAQLAQWLAQHEKVFVLTGAGCSTGSGIPDYRDESGQWKRPAPVTWQAFTGDPAVYRRYWARSHVGWPKFGLAKPNLAHHALATLGQAGVVHTLVTQNVDGLHQRAGSPEVIDLHGNLDSVVCLSCGARSDRDALQTEMEAANPGWDPGPAAYAPDGDADIAAGAEATYHPPLCSICGGLLKPDVVFFGENVPRERLGLAVDALQQAQAMLVVGSSLMVYSGFRFARLAHEAGKPLAILNRGTTRADALATLRLSGEVGATLRNAAAAYRG